MSFIIRQDRETLRRSVALQKKAELSSVRLRNSTVRSGPRLHKLQLPVTNDFKYGVTSATVEGGFLLVEVWFDFRLVEEETKKPEPMEALSIECRFEIDYELTDGHQPTPEEIEAFSSGNAIFNCWPYFREYVQSTAARMQYPTTVVPFLRLLPEVEQKQEKPQATEPSAKPSADLARRKPSENPKPPGENV